MRRRKNAFGNPVSAMPKINRGRLANALTTQIVGMSLDEVVSIMTNRYDELIEYMALISGRRACQKTSLLFNRHRLDCATATDNRYGSIYKALQDPNSSRVSPRHHFSLR